MSAYVSPRFGLRLKSCDKFHWKSRPRQRILLRGIGNPGSRPRRCNDCQQFIGWLRYCLSPRGDLSIPLEDRFDRDRAREHFNFARSEFWTISPLLDDRIWIIAVSVCRSIVARWLKIRGNGRGLGNFIRVVVGERESQRFHDQTDGEGWTFPREE